MRLSKSATRFLILTLLFYLCLYSTALVAIERLIHIGIISYQASHEKLPRAYDYNNLIFSSSSSVTNSISSLKEFKSKH
jgi:hypothetical protein